MCAPSILGMHRTMTEREMIWNDYREQRKKYIGLHDILSFRTTDKEYAAFLLSLKEDKNMTLPQAILAVQAKLEESRTGTPEILAARDALEHTRELIENARKEFGDESEQTKAAYDALFAADAALESLVDHHG